MPHTAELADAIASDRLADLRAALRVTDEKVAAANSDEVRRVLLAAYWLIPTDHPWPRGNCVKLMLAENGGIWDGVDLLKEGRELARLIAADVWRRVFGT